MPKIFLPKNGITLDKYLNDNCPSSVRRVASQIPIITWEAELKPHRTSEVFSIPIIPSLSRILSATYLLIQPDQHCRASIDNVEYSSEDFIYEMSKRLRENREVAWKRIKEGQSRKFKTLLGEEIYKILPKDEDALYTGLPVHGIMQLIGNTPLRVFDGDLKLEEVEYFHNLSYEDLLF